MSASQELRACSDFQSCELMRDFFKGESEPRRNEPDTLRTRMEWLRGRFLAYKGERAARARE
jgi:hypothetical protein